MQSPNFRQAQDGEFTFRYALTTDGNRIPDAVASKFGIESREPLIPLVTRDEIDQPFGSTGPVLEAERSFVSIDKDDVVLLTLKPAESGRGVIARVQEIGGTPTVAHLSIGGVNARAATLCDLVENDLAPLELNTEGVEVPLNRFGLATVRLITSAKDAD